jgi:hypothetical protein
MEHSAPGRGRCSGPQEAGVEVPSTPPGGTEERLPTVFQERLDGYTRTVHRHRDTHDLDLTGTKNERLLKF